jgi:hypothetical protein
MDRPYRRLYRKINVIYYYIILLTIISETQIIYRPIERW